MSALNIAVGIQPNNIMAKKKEGCNQHKLIETDSTLLSNTVKLSLHLLLEHSSAAHENGQAGMQGNQFTVNVQGSIFTKVTVMLSQILRVGQSQIL